MTLSRQGAHIYSGCRSFPSPKTIFGTQAMEMMQLQAMLFKLSSHAYKIYSIPYLTRFYDLGDAFFDLNTVKCAPKIDALLQSKDLLIVKVYTLHIL